MGQEFISLFERTELTKLLRRDNIQDAWIAGGSLLRKESPDIDVIVYTKSQFFRADADWYNFGDFKVQSIHEQYSVSDEGKDLIIKLTHPAMRPVDLLFVSSQMPKGGIKEYMQMYFPFSIQCTAVSLYTWDTVGNLDFSDQNSDIVICSKSATDEYIEKYKGYYPDKTFYKVV